MTDVVLVQSKLNCKGVYCTDLGESFQKIFWYLLMMYSQNLVSLQTRTSPVKFARKLAEHRWKQASQTANPGDGEGEESPGADAAESPGVARFSRLHRTPKHQ